MLGQLYGQTSSLPHFEYEPLPRRSIRILELEPGKRSDPFRGRFIVASIDEEIEYDALSYMWGDATPVASVIISDIQHERDSSISIAWNLTKALEYIRDRQGTKPLRIWIDAICINQTDNAERANQVAMMRLLYRKANCVRIWINEPSLESGSEALAALKKFQLEEEGMNFGLGDDPHFWDPLVPMFTNDYWSRIWIQQEVLNAQRLVLHCMHFVFTGTAVFYFRQAVFSKYVKHWESSWESEWFKTTRALMGNPSGPTSQHMFALHGAAREQMPLSELLFHKNKLRVSKPHDRLYALMQLAQDYDEGDITVDYDKSVDQVMVDAAAHHISKQGTLSFLLNSSQALNLDSQEYVPQVSWIPISWLGHNDLGILQPPMEFRIFNQCSIDPIDKETMHLRVRGLKLGTLRHRFLFENEIQSMTVTDFWSSPLGRHVTPFMSTSVPEEIHQTIRSAWMLQQFSSEAISAGLAYLHALYLDDEYSHCVIGFGQEFTSQLPQRSDQGNEVLPRFVSSLELYTYVLTDESIFGIVPECSATEGDEIWMVIGCEIPTIVRQRDDGTYMHVCTASFPTLVASLSNHEEFGKFSKDMQPGDRIGKWTVQDIDLT